MFSFCTTFIKPLIPSHLVDDLGLCTIVSCSLDTTPGFIGRCTWTIFICNATRPIKFIYQIFISYSDRDCFYEIENEFLLNLFYTLKIVFVTNNGYSSFYWKHYIMSHAKKLDLQPTCMETMYRENVLKLYKHLAYFSYKFLILTVPCIWCSLILCLTCTTASPKINSNPNMEDSSVQMCIYWVSIES